MKNSGYTWKRYARTEKEGVILDRCTDALYIKSKKGGEYYKISSGFGVDRLSLTDDEIGPERKRYTFSVKDGKTRLFDSFTGALYEKVRENGHEYFKISPDPGPEFLVLTENDMEPVRVLGENDLIFENEKYKFYMFQGIEYKDLKQEGITQMIVTQEEGSSYWVTVDKPQTGDNSWSA